MKSKWHLYAAGFARDARFGGRLLLRQPGFAAAVVACLGLGIGLATAIVTQFQASVFRSLPGVSSPGDLVALQAPVVFSQFEDLQGDSSPFAVSAAFLPRVPFLLRLERVRERVGGQIVSSNYFVTLGITAATGRLFEPVSATEDRDRIVISHRLWQRRFGGRPDVIGQTVELNGQVAVVIGVTPAGFHGTQPMMSASDLWILTTAPTSFAPELADGWLSDPNLPVARVFGRLRSGISTSEAEAELTVRIRREPSLSRDPDPNRFDRPVILVPGGRVFPVRDVDLPAVLALPAVLVGLVLTVAGMNVATMLVARTANREKELAIRLAVGASRARLIFQLMAEALVLAVLGAIAAVGFVLVYQQLIDRLVAVLPAEVAFDWSFDLRVFIVATLIAGATTGFAALLPAIQAARHIAPVSGLKGGIATAGSRPRTFSLRNILVLQQVAASLTLLLLTAFIVVGFQRSQNRSLGFNPERLALASVDPRRDGLTPSQADAFQSHIEQRLHGLADVLAATFAFAPPPGLRAGEAMMAVRREMTPGERADRAFSTAVVASDFLSTLEVPLLAGRHLQTTDTHAVMVVNRTLAEAFWPGQLAVGQRLDVGGISREIVGVVGDLGSAYALQRTPPTAFTLADPSETGRSVSQGMLLVVRLKSGADPLGWAREFARTSDPAITLFAVGTLADEVEQSTKIFRLTALIYGGIGGFGLLLAVIGLAGVTAHAVSRRTREIGIRRALGAHARDVLQLVLREAVFLVAIGCAAGLAIAFAASRVLAATLTSMSEMTDTTLADPMLLLGAPLLLAGIALLACYLPARRALQIQPIEALRSD